jgi:hypothetical protein
MVCQGKDHENTRGLRAIHFLIFFPGPLLIENHAVLPEIEFHPGELMENIVGHPRFKGAILFENH